MACKRASSVVEQNSDATIKFAKSTTINDLPSECLELIFGYLGLKTRLFCEKVSAVWRKLLLERTWKRATVLDASELDNDEFLCAMPNVMALGLLVIF